MRELERDRPQHEELPKLALVGPGKVGQAIQRSAGAAGVSLPLAGRSDLAAVCGDAEVVLLCVPDTAIADAAASVASVAGRLRLIGHTSGATGLGALASATANGAGAFSVHPLQTIPGADADLRGAPAAVSGDDRRSLRFAQRLALLLGMRPFEVPEESRAAYHAAASIASNFLVTLEESAVEILERAGVEDARELLAPLVLQTAANWSERGREALTGPIARGDEATIALHEEALAEAGPELLETYRDLAERTRQLAARKTPA
jgi:predicted short-subunit dehydrogenase-like oxidoreductase (DUF2520 family)